MKSADAFIAVTRFGLGPKPGELALFADAPRERLERALDAPPVPVDAYLLDSETILSGVVDHRIRKRSERQAAAAQGRPREKVESDAQEIYVEEIGRRYARFVNAEAPFRQRLVDFWSNHFTVSTARGVVKYYAGAFEREAIEQYATGRFADLLKAAVLHPAMLHYLDLSRSFGPNSFVGQRRNRGLNENLGREILELHTLGVDGGYTQADVIALAKILTGWTVPTEASGEAVTFDERRHEPGDKLLLGQTIREAGEHEATTALDRLAAHPATARHVARKLVRHFVADEPPSNAVEAVARVFRDTDGDLKEVARALVRLDEPWASPLPKVRSPWDYAVAISRAAGNSDLFRGDKDIVATLRKLGQPLFQAVSPAGWPDRASAWLGPEALMRRVELAQRLAPQIAAGADLETLIAGTIRPVAEDGDLQVIRRAGSQADAVALLLASPQFQRR